MVFITAVVTGRNDNYGGHLNERATYSFNTMLETFDEVIYVDWNTDSGNNILTDDLVINDRTKLKTLKVTPELARQLTQGKETQKMCEVLARNVGIRRAKGRVIVSTNIDIIPPPRKYLDILVSELKPMEMVTLSKQDVELEQLDKQFGVSPDWKTVSELLTNLVGLWPLTKRLMCPHLVVNRDLLTQVPPQHAHSFASIIMACGDFQIALKDTWHTIKGFEESMIKRSYADTVVQYKTIMAGGTVRATNYPPVYHIEHERDNNPAVQNSMDLPVRTTNADTWGFNDIKIPSRQ